MIASKNRCLLLVYVQYSVLSPARKEGDCTVQYAEIDRYLISQPTTSEQNREKKNENKKWQTKEIGIFCNNKSVTNSKAEHVRMIRQTQTRHKIRF